MTENRRADQIYWFIKTITVSVYYLLLIAVSYVVFVQCRETRHAFILTDIFNAIFGGVLLVYPLNVVRYGLGKTFEGWLAWLVILFALICITLPFNYL
jgi:hypothetical protein